MTKLPTTHFGDWHYEAFGEWDGTNLKYIKYGVVIFISMVDVFVSWYWFHHLGVYHSKNYAHVLHFFYCCGQVPTHVLQEPLLLTWFKFNPTMDK